MSKRLQLGYRPLGVATTSAMTGDQVRVETGGFHSSAEGEVFFRIVSSLTAEFLSATETNPATVENLLVVVDREHNADIYVNEVSCTALVQAKSLVNAGDPVRKKDLADIREMHLSVNVPPDCGFLYVFSIGWRKGMLFDFSPLEPGTERRFELNRALASCYSQVFAGERFTLTDEEWNVLISKGWFLFIGLSDSTIERMIDFLRSGIDLDKLLPEVTTQLSDICQSTVEFARQDPDFSSHAPFIERALERFQNNDFLSAGSILYPRIEGILRSFYQVTKPTKRPKQMTLLQTAFPPELATRFAASLLRTDHFVIYLKRMVFVDFDWETPSGASRHTVGHGVVDSNDLSSRALTLVLLTIHHLLYTLKGRRQDSVPTPIFH